jgi:serine/threonine protein kinase
MTLPADLYRITLYHTIVEQDLHYSIILPLADLGNLDQFLRDQSEISSKTYTLQPKTFNERFPNLPARAADLAGALLYQCAAIADALKWLHAGFRENHPSSFIYLAHMDLKPDNILLFDGEPVGHWKMADFGISVIKRIKGMV